jgi:hypothetical protein
MQTGVEIDPPLNFNLPRRLAFRHIAARVSAAEQMKKHILAIKRKEDKTTRLTPYEAISPNQNHEKKAN